MSNIDRAGHIMGDYEAANDLDREGLLAPDPQIIRTPAELEALDPMTVVYTPKRDTPVCAGDFLDDIRYDPDYADDLPAVKVAEGAHVRACREALEGETT